MLPQGFQTRRKSRGGRIRTADLSPPATALTNMFIEPRASDAGFQPQLLLNGLRTRGKGLGVNQCPRPTPFGGGRVPGVVAAQPSRNILRRADVPTAGRIALQDVHEVRQSRGGRIRTADLSPPATALTNMFIEPRASDAGFQPQLLLNGLRTRGKGLGVNQCPRPTPFGGGRVPGVVAAQPSRNILRRADVPTAGRIALQDVHEVRQSRGGRIRTADLLTPSQTR